MDPLERLLNLLGLLLDAKLPLTFREIQSRMEGYEGENPDSVKRAFERDKDVLRAKGIPLRTVKIDPLTEELGYEIDTKDYYLPEISFTPEESSALLVAARSDGRYLGECLATTAVGKLLFASSQVPNLSEIDGPLVRPSESDPMLGIRASAAASDHKQVRFNYRTTDGQSSVRTVDAYATIFKGGHWYLVGWDVDREAERAFRLSRFESTLGEIGDGRRPPEGFRASDHVNEGPWRAEADSTAEIEVSESLSWILLRALPGSRELDSVAKPGTRTLTVPFADADAVASILLQYGPDVRVISPESMKDVMVQRLESMDVA